MVQVRSADIQPGRRARRVATGVALVALLGAQACDPGPAAPKPGVATTTTTRGATVTTGPATTDTTAPSPTTTVPAATSTTTTTTAPGRPELALRDTGYTRLRVELVNQAAWMDLELRGTTIEASRVVSTGGELWISALGGRRIAAWGRGEAVVDLVLRVEPGATPSLAMCKNYQGPATATLRRLTDGDVVVATLANVGASPIVLPGSCENPAGKDLSRADLMGPTRWPARRDPRPLVLANYYPWYDAGALAGPFPDMPTGPADTSQPTAVRDAVDLAGRSGVDGFVVEYEGTPAHEPKIDLVFDAADAAPGFQAAMLLDFAILDSRPLGLTDAGLDRMLDEVASHAGRRSYLEVDGRPVVFLYGSSRVDPAAWAGALGRFDERTGLRPFVVADGPGVGAPGRYDYGTNHLPTTAELSAWADGRTAELQLGPGLGGGTGPLWVAPVSPGYDDRALGRPAPLHTPRDAGARYEQSWDAALRSLPDWVLVTSWNEYYEATHIMPGASTGDLALTQTRARGDRFRVTG